MTELDVRFRALSVRLINKNGKLVTVKKVNHSGYDPSTGSTINTETSVQVKAIISDFNLQSSGETYQPGLILSGDKKFSIAAADIDKPSIGDKIILEGVVYSVVRVLETWSGEQVSLYTLQART